MITLDTFLGFEFVQDLKLLYPIHSPEQIEIQSISILEPPVEKFVRENEIIISTALSVRDNSQSLYSFMQEIYESKAAALLLAFPNDDYHQLDSVKEHFERINFPILTVPWSHLFSDIVEQTLKELWEQDSRFQVHLDSLQKELLNIYLAGKSLNDAADIIHKYLGSDIQITDSNFKIKGSNIHFNSPHNSTPIPDLHHQADNTYEISSGGKKYGYVIFTGILNSLLEDIEPQLLEQCIITPLMLWFDKEWSLTTSKMKSKKTFVWRLAHDEFTSSQDIFSKAESVGFNCKCNYLCIVGNVISRSTYASYNWDVRESAFLTGSIDNIIQEQIYLVSQKLEMSVMITLQQGILVTYLEKKEDIISSELITSFLDMLDEYLNRTVPNIVLIYGYDIQEQTMDRLSLCYKNAISALNISIRSNSHSLRNCYQLSIKQKIFFTVHNDKETVDLAENTLKNILDYDKAKNSDLLDTLKCYFRCNYNITRTADEMHLHRQSLIYRLEKIESLCNLSLKDHDDLFALEICTLALAESF